MEGVRENMAGKSDIILTTSSSLDGWTVEDYLETVSAHVVAGTNLFRDVFAGLSDVFGGRSQAYQKELTAINDEALKILREKAWALRANAVIGIRLDHDELSGGGKSMFMVTALGTAVRASRNVKLQDEERGGGVGPVTSAQLAVEIRRRSIVETLSTVSQDWEYGEEFLTKGTWRFVTANQVHEVADFILKRVGQAPGPSDVGRKEHEQFTENARSYLLSLPRERAQAALLRALQRDDAADAFVYDVVREGSLLDLATVRDLLLSNELDSRKKAVQLLLHDKEAYFPEDVPLLEEILAVIADAFPSIVAEISERGRLSAKVKDRWQCSCGEKRSRDAIYCPNCLRDSQGFIQTETKPGKVVALTEARLAILGERFGGVTAHRRS